MVDENDIREKLGKLEVIGKQLEVLEEQLLYIEEVVNEHSTAEETIKGFKGEKEGAEVLVPLGANTHIYCTVGRNDKVLVGLGADISAEMGTDAAVDLIGRRKTDILNTKTELENKANQLGLEYQRLEQELQREYQELQLAQQD